MSLTAIVDNWSREIDVMRVKLATVVEGESKGFFFNSYYTEGVGEGTTQIPWIANFTLDPYLIVVSLV